MATPCRSAIDTVLERAVTPARHNCDGSGDDHARTTPSDASPAPEDIPTAARYTPMPHPACGSDRPVSANRIAPFSPRHLSRQLTIVSAIGNRPVPPRLFDMIRFDGTRVGGVRRAS